jgi:hypothetical protein
LFQFYNKLIIYNAACSQEASQKEAEKEGHTKAKAKTIASC